MDSPTPRAEKTAPVDGSLSPCGGRPVLASIALPPDEITGTRGAGPEFFHAAVLPLLVGLALFGYEGRLSVDLLQRVSPAIALLVPAYLGAWALSSGFRKLPFLSRGETAFASVGMTLIPAATVLAVWPASSVRTLGLTVALGSIVWFLVAPLLQRDPCSRLLLLPGAATEEIFDVSGGSLRHEDNRSGPLDGVVAHSQTPLSEVRHGLADQDSTEHPVYHIGYIYECLTARVFLRDSCDISGPIKPPKLYPYIKRAIDLALVLGTLPITGPLMLIAAVAIRLESPGPVLFWQERVGKGGEPFQMAKFRSMYRRNEGEDRAVFTDEEDDRVTMVGRILRTLRMDELPQFWNVLKGEMSLIGPRPEQVGLVNHFSEEMELYDHRHLVRPGITGWAQVRQGYADDRESTRRKLEYDLYYVKHQSVIVDLLIIYLTLKTLLTGFGAR